MGCSRDKYAIDVIETGENASIVMNDGTKLPIPINELAISQEICANNQAKNILKDCLVPDTEISSPKGTINVEENPENIFEVDVVPSKVASEICANDQAKNTLKDCILEGLSDQDTTNVEMTLDNEGELILTDTAGGTVDVDLTPLLDIIDWNDLCITDIEDVGNLCGVRKQLLLVENNGCYKFATFSESNVQYFQGGYYSVNDHLPANTSGYTTPDDFPTPGLIYTDTDIWADDNLGSGTINESKLINSVLAEACQNQDCAQRYRIEFTANIRRRPLIQDAYEEESRIMYRYSIDDGATWFYIRNGAGKLTMVHTFDGTQITTSKTSYVSLPAGKICVQAFQIGVGTKPLARIAFNTHDGSQATPTPILRVIPEG